MRRRLDAGDLAKLWRVRDPKGYHVEYGYSCMGYEIAGGLGVKLAAPERDVYVLVGDGSYLMLAQEIVTAVQERLKLTIVLVDNHGYASIGGLSRSVGSHGFGTQYRYRENGSLGLDSDDGSGPQLPVDLAANAESLGAHVLRPSGIDELRAALEEAKNIAGTVVIRIEADRYAGVPSYDSWWDVAVAEVSEVPEVQEARAAYEAAKRQRPPLIPAPARRHPLRSIPPRSPSPASARKRVLSSQQPAPVRRNYPSGKPPVLHFPRRFTPGGWHRTWP